MKMNKKISENVLLSIFLCFMCMFVFSCVSTPKEIRESNPNFLGDFEPFYLGEVLCLSGSTLGNIKPLEVHLYFAPRTNDIQARFRSGMNNICLTWTPEERERLNSSIEKYIALYSGDKKMENRKPTKKNAFEVGKIEILWGLSGYTRDTLANYFTNYQYLEENKPYFKINVSATPYAEEEHVSSPSVELFFSPSQLETLIELTDYELILEKLKELQTAAYEW